MNDPYEIPWERLPPTFARGLEADPANPPEPRPSATIVLLRDGPDGPEALMMKRRREAGFVPGAYVFPGGRVDGADMEEGVAALCDGVPEDGPEPAYWVAAAREAFEETGILLARSQDGPIGSAAEDATLDKLRDDLLEDRIGLSEVLTRLDARLDLTGVAYLAHWITPVVEPRRYETRFFVAEVPAGTAALADPREMVEAVWLTPEAALARFHQGSLPMVFPTVRTLEDLRPFADARSAIDGARAAAVPSRLPRLVKTPRGVTIRLLPEDEETA